MTFLLILDGYTGRFLVSLPYVYVL
jgi:hypothetical protein